MEQNPLTQQQSPVHDTRKVYISILIVVILILGTIFIVKKFGAPNYKKIKEDLAGKVEQDRQIDPQLKQELIDRVNLEDPTPTTESDMQFRKQQLINQTQ